MYNLLIVIKVHQVVVQKMDSKILDTISQSEDTLGALLHASFRKGLAGGKTFKCLWLSKLDGTL